MHAISDGALRDARGSLMQGLACAAGEFLADLHAFDPAALNWTALSRNATGPAPPGRFLHAMAAAAGRLYLFGGRGADGESSLPPAQCANPTVGQLRGQTALCISPLAHARTAQFSSPG
jgi:hypothetical protein